MKAFRNLLFGLVLFGGPAVWSAALTSTDQEWHAIQDGVKAMDTKGDGQDAYRQFMRTAQLRDELHDRLVRFRLDHPDDPRVGEATFQLLMRPPSFLVKLDPARFAAEGTAAAIYDEAAKQKWEREADAIKAAFLAAPAVRDEWRRDIMRRDLYIEARDDAEKLKGGEKIDLSGLRTRLDGWLARYPDGDGVTAPVESYMRALALANPAALSDEWDRFAQSANPALQELAEGQALILRAREHPMDWKFTALDGRSVDLAAWRGRFVLIDFWATWCVPCVAEMPEMKALYAKYHDQGLEMVGVSLDSVGDRAKLEKFVATHAIPWPQHFDGGGRRNAYAVRYGIKSIPTTILLDREGKVAVPRVRSEQLAATLAALFHP